MNLSTFSIKKSVTTSMLYLIIIGFGIFSFSRLKLDLYPDLSFPVVVVLTNYTGAGPKDVENLVTSFVEGAVSSVENVEEVNSISQYGGSVVLVKFAWGTDMDNAERQVQKYLDMYAKPYMSSDVGEPLVFAFDPSMQPIMFWTVEGDKDEAELRRISEDVLEPMFERVEGIADAFTMGGLKRQINIKLNPERMRALNITGSEIVNALRASNALIPGGSIDSAKTNYTIMTIGDLKTIDEVKNVLITVKDNLPITLDHVALVEDGITEKEDATWNSGKESIMLLLRKRSDANTVIAANNMMKHLEEMKKKNLFPEGIKLNLFFNQADIVKLSIGNLGSTAWQAVIITFIILLLFTASLRSSVAVAVSIPVSVIATFAVMDQASITLNMISLAGLALALGMLVDNSIVVTENIFRFMKTEKDPAIAAEKGSLEVKNAIIASTLTTISVFAPILFVPGIAGMMFKDMSLTICFSLIVSLIVALSLNPMLNYYFFKFPGGKKKLKLFSYFSDFIETLSDKYAVLIEKALHRRKTVLISALMLFIVSLVFGKFFLDFDFLAHSDQGFILINVETKPGIVLEDFSGKMKEVEKIVQESVPETDKILTTFGTSEGFLTLIGQSANSGLVRIKLPPISERTRKQAEIEKKLREDLKNIPGISYRIGRPNIGGGEGDMEIKIFHDDIAVLTEFGNKLTNDMRGVEGVGTCKFSLEQGRPEFNIRYDREKMKSLGIMPAAVTQEISTYFQGSRAGLFREKGREYDILVRADRQYRIGEKHLLNMPVKSSLGNIYPLSAVAKVEAQNAPLNIERFNQKRIATITLNKKEDWALNPVLTNVKTFLDSYDKPSEVQISIGGAAEDMQESFKYLFLALVTAILLVYMVMASQFESLLEPFVIIFSIPLSLIGVVILLFITSTTIQVTALIGVIMLAGIVVNNAIVLIDYLKQLRGKGHSLIEAAVISGKTRLRPVLMTAATTSLAMVPLAIELNEGSETWSPMARSVIGGLVAATFLTLIVIPVLYVSVVLTIEKIKKWLKNKIFRKNLKTQNI
ncbi:MAG: efflux RND transporter permease subunit [Pseudomonadota bacterium]